MQYWENISTREQRTLKRGLIAVCVLIFLRFAWWPLFSNIDDLQKDMANEQALITWMKPIVASLKGSNEVTRHAVQGAPRLSTIEKSFAQAGLSPFVKTLSQHANQQIVLQAQSIPFGALAQCLESIATLYGIVPLSLTATREKAGIVNVEIVF